jgi:hypothetical protein
MSNDITALMYLLIGRGISVLRESALMPMLVNQEYSLTPKQKGQTIDVPVSKKSTVYPIVPSHLPKQPSETDFEFIPVSLDQWMGADFYLTDLDRTRIEKEANFLPLTVQQKIRALANAVNEDILSKYYAVYGLVGTPGATPFSNATDRTAAKDGSMLAAKLDAQLCPKNGRAAVIDTTAEAEALALPYFANAEKSADPSVITLGRIGTKFGFDWFVENAIQRHTAGTPSSGTVQADGVHAAAPTELSDTLNVKGMTNSTGTYNKGDILTIAGQTQTYTILADMTATAGGKAALTIAPGLQVALAGDEAITLKGSHTVNLGFTREAFAMVTAPFEDDQLAGAEIAYMRDPVTGIVLRLEVSRQYKQTKWEFDILWGSACLRPEYAARLAG